METTSSKKSLWIGWIMSILAILFLTMDGVMKLIKPEMVIKGTVELGYPESTITPIGIILLSFTVIYAIPRTSVFGAILLTGYLGGVVSTHFRMLAPLFSHTLFPVYIAVLIWGGLVLRNAKLKDLLLGKL